MAGARVSPRFCLFCDAELPAGRHLYCSQDCAASAPACDEQHSRKYITGAKTAATTRLEPMRIAEGIHDYSHILEPRNFADAPLFCERY